MISNFSTPRKSAAARANPSGMHGALCSGRDFVEGAVVNAEEARQRQPRDDRRQREWR
jgi:hypothetical protein